MEKILFCDLEITGHHPGYLYHLIKFRLMFPGYPRFVLVTHPGLMKQLEPFKLPKDLHEKGIILVHPSTSQMEKLESVQSIYRKAIEEFRIFYKIAADYNVDQCHLMSLNKYQFVLGTNWARSFPCPIRGILFKPFSVMDSGFNFVTQLKSKIIKLRKYFQILWVLRNKKIRNIYVLNDPSCAQNLNRLYRKNNLFLPLPDPLLIPPNTTVYHAPDNKAELSKKTRFLVFGSLSSRKGIFLVLRALRLLPKTIGELVEICFAGHVIEKDREQFLKSISDILHERPDIHIELYNKFVPFEDIQSLFSNADYVLMPYTVVDGSSGIIGHSAFYGKPVIGPPSGLIEKLIRQYGIGISISKPINPSNIAIAITNVVKNGSVDIDRFGMRRFVEERQPERFVKTLIEND